MRRQTGMRENECTEYSIRTMEKKSQQEAWEEVKDDQGDAAIEVKKRREEETGDWRMVDKKKVV